MRVLKKRRANISVVKRRANISVVKVMVKSAVTV
jgi:hypothetical protein